MPLTQVNPGLLDTQAQYTGFKNRIINGAMMIDQRNAGASVTPANGATTYTVDRFKFFVNQASKLTAQQSTVAPAGFTNSLLITSSSAYSPTGTDIFNFEQTIEGFNLADLGWGTANAQTVTISFWVRSSITGTFGGALLNSAQNRSYPFTYVINASNTWEQKSITIPGDTTGTWLTNNGAGLTITLSMGAGTTYRGTAGAWTGSAFYSATGAANLVATNGATFYITGYQLEKGSTATSFDYRPYGTELQLCQRYFISYGGNQPFEHFALVSQTATTDGRGMIFLPVQMRTVPSVGQSGSFSMNAGTSSVTGTFSAGTTMYFSIGGNFSGTQNLGFDFWPGTAGTYNLTSGSMWVVRANNSTATRLTFSAEL